MPFKKGVSGNPKGRPPGTRLSTWLRIVGDELDKDKDGKSVLGANGQPQSNFEAIARAVVDKAKGSADMFAVSFLAERTDGKVKDVLEIERRSRLPEASNDDLVKKLKSKGKQGRGK